MKNKEIKKDVFLCILYTKNVYGGAERIIFIIFLSF